MAMVMLISAIFPQVAFAQEESEYIPVTLSMFSNLTNNDRISGYYRNNVFYVSIYDIEEISGGWIMDTTDVTVHFSFSWGMREFILDFRDGALIEIFTWARTHRTDIPTTVIDGTVYVSALHFLHYTGAIVQLDKNSGIQLMVAVRYDLYDALVDYVNHLQGGFFWWDQISFGNMSVETRLTISGVIALINRDSNIFRMMFNPAGIQREAIESVLLTILTNEGNQYLNQHSFAQDFVGLLSDANKVQGDLVKFITDVYKTDATANFGNFLNEFSQYAGMTITYLVNAIYAIETMRKFDAVTENQSTLLENTMIRHRHRSQFLSESYGDNFVRAAENVYARVTDAHTNNLMAAQDAANATAWSFVSGAAAVANPASTVWTYTNMIVGHLPVVGPLIQGHVQMSNAYYASMIQLAANELLFDTYNQMKRDDFFDNPVFQYEIYRRLQDAMVLQIKATLTTREFLIRSNELTDNLLADMEAVNVMVANLLHRVQMAEIPRRGVARLPMPNVDIGWLAEINDIDYVYLFYEFLTNERLLINTSHETTLGMIELPWGEFLDVNRLDLSGTINYKIVDFDNADRYELLLIRMLPYVNEDNVLGNAIFSYVYGIVNGVVTMKDYYLLMVKMPSPEEQIDIFIKNTNETLLIVAERQTLYGIPYMAGDGVGWEIRALEFRNDRFNKVVSGSLSDFASAFYGLSYALFDQVQRELYGYGIIVDIIELESASFNSGLFFNRLALHSEEVEIICVIKTSNVITWEHIYRYWGTSEAPTMPLINIRFSNEVNRSVNIISSAEEVGRNISTDWQELFSTTFEELFGNSNPEMAGIIMGGEVY